MEAQFEKAKVITDGNVSYLCIAIPYIKAKKFVGEMKGEYELNIKPYKPKRSLDANAYCWVLIDKIAATIHISKKDLYMSYIKDIGGNSTTVCVQDEAVESMTSAWRRNGIGWQTETMPSKIEGCTNVILYYGSSTFDTQQMSVLIDRVVQDARVLEIETMTPEQLKGLVDRWAL